MRRSTTNWQGSTSKSTRWTRPRSNFSARRNYKAARRGLGRPVLPNRDRSSLLTERIARLVPSTSEAQRKVATAAGSRWWFASPALPVRPRNTNASTKQKIGCVEREIVGSFYFSKCPTTVQLIADSAAREEVALYSDSAGPRIASALLASSPPLRP
jgi:hypothetical protein